MIKKTTGVILNHFRNEWLIFCPALLITNKCTDSDKDIRHIPVAFATRVCGSKLLFEATGEKLNDVQSVEQTMFNSASELILLFLTATIAIFFTDRLSGGRISRAIRTPQAKDELKSRLRNFERKLKPVKTALTQVEFEVASNSHSITRLQTRIAALRAQAIQDRTNGLMLNTIEYNAENNTRTHMALARLDEILSRQADVIKHSDLSLDKVQGMHSTLGDRTACIQTNFDINLTTAKRARTQSVALQREINKQQRQLNSSTQQKTATGSVERPVQQAGIDKRLKQSICRLQETLNKKIKTSKTAAKQHDMLNVEMTGIEEQLKTLETEVHSLQKRLRGGKKNQRDIIFTTTKKIAEIETQHSDSNTAENQLTNLQKEYRKLQHEHTTTQNKSEQRISDLTRELDRSEIKLNNACDKATAAARATEAGLKNKISALEKQLDRNNSALKFTDLKEARRIDGENKLEIAEIKGKLKELNKLLADTMEEKRALQKQLDRKTDSKQPVFTISESIGIVDSTVMPAKKNKKQKTG